MKKSTKLFFLSFIAFCFTKDLTAQELLPGVTVVSFNYKYLKSVNDTNAAQPVRLLEHKAAGFDLKNSEFYEEDYDNYYISFYLPEGEVLAFYDNKGKIEHAAERFKNVALPNAVATSLANKYPGWILAKDFYLVKYYSDPLEVNKVYKLILKKDKERMKVKVNEKGEEVK
jgi:hypothetical protein